MRETHRRLGGPSVLYGLFGRDENDNPARATTFWIRGCNPANGLPCGTFGHRLLLANGAPSRAWPRANEPDQRRREAA